MLGHNGMTTPTTCRLATPLTANKRLNACVTVSNRTTMTKTAVNETTTQSRDQIAGHTQQRDEAWRLTTWRRVRRDIYDILLENMVVFADDAQPWQNKLDELQPGPPAETWDEE